MRCQCVTFAANQRQTADDEVVVAVAAVVPGCLGGGGLGGRTALGALTATKM